MRRSLFKAFCLAAVLICSLFVCFRSEVNEPQFPAPYQIEKLALSAPLEGVTPLEPPEVILREEELPPDLVTVSDGNAASAEHVHAFRLTSSREPDCSRAGERIYRCECGQERAERLAPTPHTIIPATCTEPAVCAVCGAVEGGALGHLFDRDPDVCSRCGKELTASFYVLGQELEYGEPASSVREKLGSPTETVVEGDLVTLVYASDLKKLTFVQTDVGGVWGVFSFDAALRFRTNGRGYGMSDFSGSEDYLSDAELCNFVNAMLYAFRDRPGTGRIYAMWMRLMEYGYDFSEDPALNGDYSGQVRLSWYLLNAQRARSGLRPLSISPQATEVAREYCEVMIATGVFDHDNSFADRLTEKNVPWQYAGENLSRGYINCIFVCDAYYNSPSHRENLLYAAFTHVGLAYVRDGRTVFGAQEFYHT